ncbi:MULTISPECIES: crossover junction endodeoxyribonuclease RuvC [Moraxella]|jgi:crossover junction endodeoxyribonuclease ruvC|uniref:Crossover junction endodeoxyribonuclease RuvC n=2 Tax=Moraxella TaxID=475 RepID=A0A1B8PKG4_MORNO|nr:MULTISPECIES: crossover junction endodeoxyribonuclease RuvC [Moraxella]MBE9579735.1 crossover junction endodeoxyribonuclease RuvC [Moraxella sp. K1664]MBE9589083.1 crossover junction endodeoxyribonuclease RuvC [Moraxella sp. K1630]MBE9589652.1 crossover junction endodeoxyribonuclease RuvC [Moraxella sp. K127]MBE9597344.1 crossover junction endodeoxyribonuclease RuvC [Moraxella sp. K2450]MDH9219867.1 crossover junction endodeoxyribonuclease RuvC [Moraxella lacunata]
MTLIIGIDPGSRMTGYGIVRSVGDGLTFMDAGTIRTDSMDMPVRIGQIFDGITRIVQHYQKYYDEPIHSAIEQVFMATNPDSALKLGQARGAAIASLSAQGLTVSEYTARQIKQAVCGYGAADKEQVTAMVCRLLALDVVPQADAADGLACAICHAHSSHSMHKLLGNAALKGRSVSKKKGRWRLSETDLLIQKK